MSEQKKEIYKDKKYVYADINNHVFREFTKRSNQSVEPGFRISGFIKALYPEHYSQAGSLDTKTTGSGFIGAEALGKLELDGVTPGEYARDENGDLILDVDGLPTIVNTGLYRAPAFDANGSLMLDRDGNLCMQKYSPLILIPPDEIDFVKDFNSQHSMLQIEYLLEYGKPINDSNNQGTGAKLVEFGAGSDMRTVIVTRDRKRALVINALSKNVIHSLSMQDKLDILNVPAFQDRLLKLGLQSTFGLANNPNQKNLNHPLVKLSKIVESMAPELINDFDYINGFTGNIDQFLSLEPITSYSTKDNYKTIVSDAVLAFDTAVKNVIFDPSVLTDTVSNIENYIKFLKAIQEYSDTGVRLHEERNHSENRQSKITSLDRDEKKKQYFREVMMRLQKIAVRKWMIYRYKLEVSADGSLAMRSMTTAGNVFAAMALAMQLTQEVTEEEAAISSVQVDFLKDWVDIISEMQKRLGLVEASIPLAAKNEDNIKQKRSFSINKSASGTSNEAEEPRDEDWRSYRAVDLKDEVVSYMRLASIFNKDTIDNDFTGPSNSKPSVSEMPLHAYLNISMPQMYLYCKDSKINSGLSEFVWIFMTKSTVQAYSNMLQTMASQVNQHLQKLTNKADSKNKESTKIAEGASNVVTKSNELLMTISRNAV